MEGELEPEPLVDEARRRLLTLPVGSGFFTTHYDGAVNEFYVLRSRDEGEEFGFAKTHDGDGVVEEFVWEQPGRRSPAFPHGEWVEWEEGTTLSEALRNGVDDYYLFEGLG